MNTDLSASNVSFEDIVETFADMVTRICMVQLKNTFDTQDCFQNVFLKLFCNDIKYKSLMEIKKWLIVVTMNECKDWKRKLFVRKYESLDTLEIPYVDAEHVEIMQQIKSLPSKYSILLYLYYYEGYCVNEISELLHKNESAVKTGLFRARKMLKGVILDEERRSGVYEFGFHQ